MTISNVIVCDDHHVSVLGIEILLREHLQSPLRIRTASTGKKAIDHSVEEMADLVLIDLGLPDISGLEVIKKIRSYSPESRILVLTGSRETHLLQQVYQMKINGILQKAETTHNLGKALDFVQQNPDRKYLDPSIASLLEASDSQPLSNREHEVLELMSQGHTSDQIAAKMGCSVTTVKTYRTRIMNKSGTRNSSEMIAWYLKGNRDKHLSSYT